MRTAIALKRQQPRSMDIVAPNASPLHSLKGGIAVITGGASGIGLAVAHAALERGLCVCSARAQPFGPAASVDWRGTPSH